VSNDMNGKDDDISFEKKIKNTLLLVLAVTT
jgi:hypothetical protein